MSGMVQRLPSGLCEEGGAVLTEPDAHDHRVTTAFGTGTLLQPHWYFSSVMWEFSLSLILEKTTIFGMNFLSWHLSCKRKECLYV